MVLAGVLNCVGGSFLQNVSCWGWCDCVLEGLGKSSRWWEGRSVAIPHLGQMNHAGAGRAALCWSWESRAKFEAMQQKGVGKIMKKLM